MHDPRNNLKYSFSDDNHVKQLKEAFSTVVSRSSDVSIISEDKQQIHSNRRFLGIFSPSLRDILGNIPDHVYPTIILPDCSSSSINNCLKIITGNSIQFENVENWSAMVKTANVLGIKIRSESLVNSSIKAEPMEYDDSNGNVADQTDVNGETQLKESSNDKAVDLNQDNSILTETNLDSGINSFLELSSDNRIVSSTPKQIQPFRRSDLSEETISNIDNDNDRDALQPDAIKQETFNFDDISPKELITKQADHKICQITNCAKTITPHGKLRDHYVNHFWDELVNKYGKFVDNVICVLCSRVFSTRQSALKHVAIWHSKINEILTSKNYFPLPLQINIKDQPLNDDLEANVSNEELSIKSLGGGRPGIERHDDKTKPVEAKHNFNQQNEVTDKSVTGGTSVNHNPITNLKEPMTILYDNLQSGENGDSSQVKEEPWEPLEADVEHEKSQINDIPSNAMEREEIKKELFDFDRNVIPKEMITEQSVHKLCQVCLKSETDMSNLRNHYTTHFMKEINERYGKFVDDKSCTYCTPPKLLSSHNAVLRHIATWHSKVNSILTSKNLLPLPLTLNVKDTERETPQERTGSGQPIPSSSALGFPCQLCNQNLKSFSALRYHFYTKHFKIEVNAQFGHLADEETGLTCLLCKNKQSSKQGTMNHIAIIHSKVNEVIAEKGMGYLLTGNTMVEGKVFSDVLAGGKDPNEALVGGKATSETLTEGKTPSESLDGGKTAIETMVPRKAPSETLAGGKAPIETLAGGKTPSKGLDGVKATSETFIGGKAPTETTFDNTPGTPVPEKIPEQQNITKTEKSSEAMAKKQLIQRLISTPHNEMYQPNKEATEPTKEKNTSEVSDILLEEFKKDPFLTKERTKLISEKVNMTESIVWKWFYSARKRKSEDNQASNDSTVKPKATKEILTSDKELANSKNKQISYFSESKEMKLKKEFFVSKHLNKERTQKIASEVKLSEEQVEKWFAERIKLISQNKPPFTIDKLKRLNYEFCQSQNLSRERSKSLALQLGLNEKQIVQWFTTKIRSHNNRPGMDKESNLSVNKTSDVPQTYINKNRVEPQTSVNKNTGDPQTSGDKNTASPQTPFNKTGDITQMSINKTNAVPQTSQKQSNVVPETSANKTNMTPQTFVNKNNASPQTFVNKTNGAPQTSMVPPTSNSKSTLWPQSSAFKPNRSLKSFINKTNVPPQISINKISMKQKYFNKTNAAPQNSESKTNIMSNVDLTKSGGFDITKTGGMSPIDPKTSVIPEALVSKSQLIVSKTNVTPQPPSNKTFQSSVNNNFVKAQFTGNKTNAIPQSSVNKPNGMSMSSVISNAMSQFSVNKPNGIPPSSVNKSNAIPPSSVNKSNAIPPSSVNKTNATLQSSFNKANGMPPSSVNKTNAIPQSSFNNKSNAMPQSSVNKTNNDKVPASINKPNMTINQLLRLEKEFNLNQLKTKEIRNCLASEINVTEKDVDQWLQQRNMVKQKFAGGADASKTITAVKNAETKQVQNKRTAETESNKEVKRTKMEEAIVGKVIKMENNLSGSNIDNYEHQSKKAAYSCGCGESFLSDEAFAIHKSYTCKNLTVGTIPQRS